MEKKIKSCFVVFSNNCPIFFSTGSDGNLLGIECFPNRIRAANHFSSREEAWTKAEEAKLEYCEVREVYSFK